MCGVGVRWGTVIPHLQGHLLVVTLVTFSCSHHGLPAKDAPRQARRPACCTPLASAWGLQPPPSLQAFRSPMSDGNTSPCSQVLGSGSPPPPSSPRLCQRPLPPSGCPSACLPFAVPAGGSAHRSYPVPSRSPSSRVPTGRPCQSPAP